MSMTVGAAPARRKLDGLNRTDASRFDTLEEEGVFVWRQLTSRGE